MQIDGRQRQEQDETAPREPATDDESLALPTRAEPQARAREQAGGARTRKTLATVWASTPWLASTMRRAPSQAARERDTCAAAGCKRNRNHEAVAESARAVSSRVCLVAGLPPRVGSGGGWMRNWEAGQVARPTKYCRDASRRRLGAHLIAEIDVAGGVDEIQNVELSVFRL